MKKILFWIIIIVLLIGLCFGGYYLYSKSNNSNKKTPAKNKNEVVEEVEDSWFTKLNIRLIELFNEKYPLDYVFDVDDDGNKTFTLKDLKELGVDVSEFNTDVIHCDEDNSKLIITKKGEEFLRMTALDCTNDNEETK